jgi:hypothetical protein
VHIGLVDHVGDRRDELRRCEGLCDHRATGDTLDGPFLGAFPAHVDDGHCWDEFARAARNFPSLGSGPQMNVGDMARNRAASASISLTASWPFLAVITS